MFDVAPQELLLLGAVAVAVIPPKDLPRAMRFAGQWIGRARGMARHFRSGLDEMIRQAELEEIEQKWREENERIMREHPLHDAIEPASVADVRAALPHADDPSDEGQQPMTIAATAELPPALPHGSPAVSDAEHDTPEKDRGPELPLGLPPAP